MVSGAAWQLAKTNDLLLRFDLVRFTLMLNPNGLCKPTPQQNKYHAAPTSQIL